MNTVSTIVGSNQPRCYNSQLKPFYHGKQQRYTSPFDGQCKRLIVQSVNPNLENSWGEQEVHTKMPSSTYLAAWLSKIMVNPSGEIAIWVLVWLAYIISLFIPSREPVFDHYYKPYLMRFIGQLWAARSPREYSLRSRTGEDDRLVRRITHALYPRSLIVFDATTGIWTAVSDEAVVKRKPYVAVTYCYDDMTPSGTGMDVLVQWVRDATLHQGFDAYWLDLECLLEDPTQKAQDLYRMSDIYRRASFTLIILSDETAWGAWGSRVWTLPEALLSRELRYKAGNNEVTHINLFQIASLAYSHHDEESQIINSFGLGKDSLERLDRNLHLKEAIWRRKSSSPQIVNKEGNSQERYRAEKVYALMGFFEHRILPDAEETELQALARLFMANDTDRIADRMVSMLPRGRRAMKQWYTKEDEYGAKLWDIEPIVQVIGVTCNGSLVLDGCRAAAIRWKSFPSVAFATRRSIRRLLALTVPFLALTLVVASSLALIIGTWLKNNWIYYQDILNGSIPDLLTTGGGILLAISLTLMIFAPLMTTYGHSGRVVHARPWLIGVKGVISAKQASEYLYGGQIGDFRRTLYTASGSPLARPTEDDSKFREGHTSQYEAALTAPPYDPIEGHMFTLVDTVSSTIYYFRAHRPPTVCLFTGTEGGQGRFVLCSGMCSSSELRRETVLRMPSYISAYMHTCDWVALGGQTSGSI
ncbi:hypothetical protein M405DRAFT_827741 [Rhizopogon salebrosus TDB-379]|nr:hypothetical protein M405DRAFT_827741 [Rhizopogon salebrosus TDB-379]